VVHGRQARRDERAARRRHLLRARRSSSRLTGGNSYSKVLLSMNHGARGQFSSS
jgi:hypothetical protein